MVDRPRDCLGYNVNSMTQKSEAKASLFLCLTLARESKAVYSPCMTRNFRIENFHSPASRTHSS